MRFFFEVIIWQWSYGTENYGWNYQDGKLWKVKFGILSCSGSLSRVINIVCKNDLMFMQITIYKLYYYV